MSRVERVMAVAIGVLLILAGVLAVGLAYERGHNTGYNEGWYDGTAYESYEGGWRHCIEENNLYERYEYGQ